MLAVLIVNWNVRELLRNCVASLLAHAPTDCAMHIVVVDNASSDDSVVMLRDTFSELVQVVENKSNRGFSGGNNDGLRVVQTLFAQSQDAKNFVLLLNPDTVIHHGCIDALLLEARENPGIAVVGPRVMYGDGSPQSTRRRFPTLATAMFESTWLQKFAPARLLENYHARDLPDDVAADVDWVVGAAMLVRADALAQVGDLDEANFFMYSEELDWCKRFKTAGWRVRYQPNATLTHFEGQSSGQVSERRMILFNSSKVRYFRKHHGQLQAKLLKATLLGQFAWQCLIETIKASLHSQPVMRNARVRIYRMVMQALVTT